MNSETCALCTEAIWCDLLRQLYPHNHTNRNHLHHHHRHHDLWGDLLHQLCPLSWWSTISFVTGWQLYYDHRLHRHLRNMQNMFFVLFQAKTLLQHLCWLHFWPDRSISEQHQWKSFLCFSIAVALKRAHWSIRGHSVQLLWRPPFKCSPESFSERLARPLATHIWYIS